MENGSVHSAVPKQGSETSPSFSKGTSGDQEKAKPLLVDSEKSIEGYSSDHLTHSHLTNSNRFDRQDEFSALGIRDIVSWLQLVNYKSKNLNITTDERKETNGLFPSRGKLLPGYN